MLVQEVKSDFIIQTENLSKEYVYYKKEIGIKGSIKNLLHREKLYKQAVKNLSIQIPKGEIIGFIGLNGAGKTTTLKMLTGIIAPTSGNVQVLGYYPFDKKKEYLKQITMVMGNKSQLWWDLPAIDSFHLNKTIYEIEDFEFKKTLDLMVEMMGVEKQLHVQVRRLSLGERMKMELIASLLHKPSVVFLDEPTIGLDVITQYNIRKFLKEYNSLYGSTIILTSHNFNDIVSLCNSIILINNGEKIYSSSFKNFEKEFFNKKYFILKLKTPNAESIIKKLKRSNYPEIEKIDDTSIKISTTSEKSMDILKDLSGKFLDELLDINIENISMDDVIRKIYQD
ncbi:ABC transporter ATP-binding protein [Fusobacterium necrophorum]|uniref:ABC transporter ATP-binding protein n=1 Tax=Fusobacterium necrophorum DJ-2 TaxID=1441737 RepID=A0AB73BZL9_9FUSO|nr:ATP-binding cassette domain-containing protein [Fusobacterium necrophorum]KDE61500.1 ABC transporter ATP-binding protein [Fusobacterium necrophorum DJ-1]KDE63047.1 ABC transporter ATP-binding protein [Fusobacterium necrophorum BFTR-1]KDE69010.1 ABC transporter ATP-binding protein [Fusobacterium necrophorum DJ-2]